MSEAERDEIIKLIRGKPVQNNGGARKQRLSHGGSISASLSASMDSLDQRLPALALPTYPQPQPQQQQQQQQQQSGHGFLFPYASGLGQQHYGQPTAFPTNSLPSSSCSSSRKHLTLAHLTLPPLTTT
jgi:hypothetical protein